MKDSLIDRPPTIGDLRRQGVTALQVRCQRPCKRIGRVPLDALRLPDDTIVRSIPTLRRLRCSQCDRLVAEISAIYPQREPPKIGDLSAAHWAVVIRDPSGREATSSPLWSRLEAVDFAKRQEEAGAIVLRIRTPTGIVDGDEIAAWSTASRD